MWELAGWKHQIVELLGYWVFPKDERDTRKFGKDDQTLWKRRKTSQCFNAHSRKEKRDQ